MKNTLITLTVLAILICGCGSKTQDSRISLQEGVASDTLGSNIVTKPVMHAFSALVGDRIQVNNAALRRNRADILELQVEFFNKSYNTERFQYKVEWVDAEDFVINSKTNVWTPMSVAGKSNGTITAFAPSASAVNFRMNTRNQE